MQLKLQPSWWVPHFPIIHRFVLLSVSVFMGEKVIKMIKYVFLPNVNTKSARDNREPYAQTRCVLQRTDGG